MLDCGERHIAVVSITGQLYVGLIDEYTLRNVDMAERSGRASSFVDQCYSEALVDPGRIVRLACGGDNVLVADAGAILTSMAIEKYTSCQFCPLRLALMCGPAGASASQPNRFGCLKWRHTSTLARCRVVAPISQPVRRGARCQRPPS